ncbi:MAG: PBECR4 domain-containing protein [Huintestinicola sp.]|uniref:PBECR4 domain-containing protein n=1 Tax=Huintestinicola sp. TaxID=2981661 RepID=UPI003F102E0C
MDLLLEAAENFRKLLDIKYDVLLGRKNREVEISIIFRPIDFHHLAGLQYIKDMPELKCSREKVFQAIRNDSALRMKISSSVFFADIRERLTALKQIEYLLDNNDLIFKYDYKKNKMSKMKADFLIQASDEEQEITYIFGEHIAKCTYMQNETKEVYCKSIFKKGNMDYSKFQSKFTVLKISKICISENKLLSSYVNPNYREKN